MNKNIQFGVLCDTPSLEKWQVDSILEILKLEGATLKLIITGREPVKRSHIWERLKFKWKNLFWYVYLFSVRARFKLRKKISLHNLFDRIETIECEIENKNIFLNKPQIDLLRESRLDFFLNFSSYNIKGELLRSTKFGVWSFYYGDEEKYRGSPACFWEIFNRDPVTKVSLVRLTDSAEEVILLKKGILKTNNSFIKNREQINRVILEWPAILCVDIKNNNIEIFSSPGLKLNAPLFRAPNNWQLLKYFFIVNYYSLKGLFQQLFYLDIWNIGVAKGDISKFLVQGKPDVDWLPINTKKVFYADPFGLSEYQFPSVIHIYCEAFDFRNGKGIIDYIKYDGKFTKSVNVIKAPTHLSYPYIIKHNGDVFIVPENFESNTISLYRAKKFPLTWGKEKVLINNFAGVDNTIIKYDGLYWMFTSDKRDGVHYNLKLFYSADFLNDHWTPHPKNPVKTDVTSSRCAGTPFEFNNDIYRPAMDYSEKKEGRIIINKILKLTKTEYDEIKVKEVNPYVNSKFPDKIHTLCKVNNYTLIDGARVVNIFSGFMYFKYKLSLIIKKIKKRFG